MNVLEKLIAGYDLSVEEFAELIRRAEQDQRLRRKLTEEAVRLRKENYGTDVYLRGLIEFTNYCRNDCYYCGIRRSNRNAVRYRLTEEEILVCCREGYELGFRTFVLQGGEDPFYTDERMAGIIRRIRGTYPDCAVTLSLGERSRRSYQLLREAGADRYLLRHEAASGKLYEYLHPAAMSLARRRQCLYDLRELGYQVGAGFMVGAPGQTVEDLAVDLVFLKELNPHMVGIGPFLPHHDTRFAGEPAGSVERTLLLLAVIRILLPKVLLPATTALGTADPSGRERGLAAGANVVMPNLSPAEIRKKYELYDHKVCTGEEAAEGVRSLEESIRRAGYRTVCSRGDSLV